MEHNPARETEHFYAKALRKSYIKNQKTNKNPAEHMCNKTKVIKVESLIDLSNKGKMQARPT